MDKNCVRFISQLKNIQTLQNHLYHEADAFSNERPLDRREVIEKLLPLFKIRGDLKRELGLLFAEIYIGSENFFGPAEVLLALGIELDPKKIPELGFTKEDLEGANELNQFLILRVDEDDNGQPLTMQKMIELTGNKTKDKEKILFNAELCKTEDFFSNEPIKLSWALVTKKIVENTVNKNYLEQYEGLIAYLRDEVFKNRVLPREYQEAIREYEEKKSDIEAIINSNRQVAAIMLEGLKITRLLRHAPVESLYDLIVVADGKGKSSGQKILSNTYDWSCRTNSEGKFVSIGFFGGGSGNVARCIPDGAGKKLGACLSRRSSMNK